jgi:hypothetical protein
MFVILIIDWFIYLLTYLGNYCLKSIINQQFLFWKFEILDAWLLLRKYKCIFGDIATIEAWNVWLIEF